MISSRVGAGPAVADVGLDGVVEKERLLADQGDLAPQRAQCEVADVDAVDEDAAGRGIVETHQQRGERRLAGAAGADQGDHLALFHCEGDVGEHGAVGRVRVLEADTVIDDRLAELLQLACAGFLAHQRPAVEVFEDALAGSGGLLEDVVNAGEALDRLVEQQQRGDERHEVAGGHLVRLDLLARVGEQADDGEGAPKNSMIGDGSACWAM